MSTAFPCRDPLDELRWALAEALVDEQPSSATKAAVLDAAEATRSFGTSALEVPPIDPATGFARAIEDLDALLAGLTPQQWRSRTVRDLDVQGLVGHLIGVEQHFGAGLRGEPQTGDHVISTDPHAVAQQGRPVEETLAEWRSVAGDVLDLVAAQTDRDRIGGAFDSAPEGRAELIRLHQLALPWPEMLVARSFEVWTHAEDIRRANDLELRAPDAATLQLMTELGASLLLVAVALAGGGSRGGCLRLVLTGGGGGTWNVDFGAGAVVKAGSGSPAADVRIVADAVEFCRLVANRRRPAEAVADMTGDAELGDLVLAGAAMLALD